MYSEDGYTSLPPRQNRYPYRRAPSLVTRGSPAPRLSKHPPGTSILSGLNRFAGLDIGEAIRRQNARIAARPARVKQEKPEDSKRNMYEDYDIYPSHSAGAVPMNVSKRSIPTGIFNRRGPVSIGSATSASSDSDSDSDDGWDISMPDTSRTQETSLLSPSDSGLSAIHGGVSRGRQSFPSPNARRLAGVANRDTISKDNTSGEEAREEQVFANMCRKICRTPQQATSFRRVMTSGGIGKR